MRRLLVSALALACLAACEAGSGGPHRPAPDVRHVWTNPFGDAVVYDAAVSGPHVAVLFHGGAYILAISHDGGEHFEVYDYLPRADEYVSTEAGLGGVMVSSSGEVFLIIRYQGFSPPLGPVVSFTAQPFDEETGTYEGRSGPAVGAPWARVSGDRLETYSRINRGDPFVMTYVDVATGEHSGVQHIPDDEPRCFGAAFGPDPATNAFVSTCPDGVLTCFASASPRLDSPTSVVPTLRCVPTDELRAPSFGFERMHAGFLMYDLGGRVFGERPAPAGVERVDFGPGTVPSRFERRVRVPFARYLPIAAPDSDPTIVRELERLVHVPPRGEPREPSFPRSPCEGECAPASSPQLRLGNLLWLTPLEEADTFLAIYGVRDDAGDHFYLRRVEDRAEAGPSTRPAGGELERACARLAACYPGVAAADLRNCIDTFARMRGRSDAEDLAYQRFLASGEAECDAFLSTTWGAWDGVPCTPGCSGGIAVSCDEGPSGPASRVNCYELGVDCRVDAATSRAVCGPELACTDEVRCEGERLVYCRGEYRVTDCGALGLLCDPSSGGCALDEACVDGGSTRCDGDVLVSSGCSESGRRVVGHDLDCRRLGLTCDPIQLACGTGRASTCADGEAPTCDGSRVVYCLGGEMREIDCASIGFSTCTLVDGVGTCAL